MRNYCGLSLAWFIYILYIVGSRDGIAAALKVLYEKKNFTGPVADSSVQDVLSFVPTSILDDKLKQSFRDISVTADALWKRFDAAAVAKHPLLINVNILRLYAIQRNRITDYRRTESAKDSSVKTKTKPTNNSDVDLSAAAIDGKLHALLLLYLDYASHAYNTDPQVPVDDVVLNVLHEKDPSYVKTPRHGVFLDHLTKSIVVTIRGTATISDVLTDLYMDATPFLHDEDQNVELFAHRGMAESAGVLLEPIYDAIKQARARSKGRYKDYEVVVTGHSLGAGTACLLGILLHHVHSLAVKVFAFAPPPTLSSKVVHKKKKGFFARFRSSNRNALEIISVVNNEDSIPRCSHHEIINMVAALMAIDQLPISPVDRTTLSLRGELSDAQYEQIRLALESNPRHRFMPKVAGDVELFIPGKVYLLKPEKEIQHSACETTFHESIQSGYKAFSSGYDSLFDSVNAVGAITTPGEASVSPLDTTNEVNECSKRSYYSYGLDMWRNNELTKTCEKDAETVKASSPSSDSSSLDGTDHSSDERVCTVLAPTSRYEAIPLLESNQLFSGYLIAGGETLVNDHSIAAYNNALLRLKRDP